MLPDFGLKNGKYSAAVASVSWLTDAAYPLRVHKVFLRFSNLDLTKNLSPNLLAELCGAALKLGTDFIKFLQRTKLVLRTFGEAAGGFGGSAEKYLTMKT